MKSIKDKISVGERGTREFRLIRILSKMVAEKHKGDTGWSLLEFICTDTKITS